MNCDLFDQNGEKKGTINLPKEFFGIEPNEELIHRALVMQQANRRHPIAHTLTRSEIKCSARRVYRQKGTGNARHSAKNANLFRGGAVIFGPRNVRNFKKMMPRAQRRLAIFSAFSIKAAEKKIIGITDFNFEKPSTKTIANLLQKIGVSRSALILISDKNDSLLLSVRNLQNAKSLMVQYANIEDLLKYDNIIITESSVLKLKEVFTSK